MASRINSLPVSCFSLYLTHRCLIFTKSDPNFGMGEQLYFVHVQTPLGFGMIVPMFDAFLVLITAPKVKLGLMHYLITSTKTKLSKIPEFRDRIQTTDYEGPFTELLNLLHEKLK